MKFLFLIWSSLLRKRGRTILIFLQVTVAFALFGLLQGVKTAVDHAIAAARADLLIVHSRLSFNNALPVGLIQQIKSVPGVKEVIPVCLLAAAYQNPTQQMGMAAIRPDPGWQSAFTFEISPADAAAFRSTRNGILVTSDLEKMYGWKSGDQIPLMTDVVQRDGSNTWAFKVVGTFKDTDLGAAPNRTLINYDYLNEGRYAGKDTVQHFNVRVADPKMATTVSEAIDAQFTNSPHETRSESLRLLAQMNFKSIGDFEFLVRAIVIAVFTSLLFATATMMIQSVRERRREIAVLKTVGFTNGAVFALTLAEAVLVCAAAAACGLGLATLAIPHTLPQFHVSMPAIIVAVGLGSAVLVALCSAAVPAIQATRIAVAAALSGRQ
jgi:putative ABC transport system permease protein